MISEEGEALFIAYLPTLFEFLPGAYVRIKISKATIPLISTSKATFWKTKHQSQLSLQLKYF